MDKTGDIVFFLVTITVVLILLSVLIINLLLVGRNRKLKHRNELLKMTADYQKELMKTQIEVVENTLNDISRQLHDDVGQMITFSIVQLNNIETASHPFKTEISNVKDSVQASLQSVREISKFLSTDYLASFGIVESLKRLIQQVSRTTGIEVNLDFPSTVVFKSQANEIFAFRILQELITNTIKHAKASAIRIYISQENEQIEIVYEDDGKGIVESSFEAIKANNSLGLTNIVKRAELMKGKIAIPKTESGFGFKLTFPN